MVSDWHRDAGFGVHPAGADDLHLRAGIQQGADAGFTESGRSGHAARHLADGDVVRVFNARGQVLAGAVVSDRYAPGVARIHEGAWYDPDKGGEPGALCKYGNPNVLTIDIGTSQLAQATSAHTTLVEIEKYNGTVEQVTAFNGPVEMVAQCEYVPASQGKS